MARDVVWRRAFYEYQGEAGNLGVDATERITYWVNAATLTVGQTLTRCYGRLHFSRLSSAAGDYETVSHAPNLVGAFLQDNSQGQAPLITPSLNPGDQSWFLYDMVSIDREWQNQDSNDGRENAYLTFDNRAQRKAKGTGAATTAVKFCWSLKTDNTLVVPGWQMHAAFIACAVLLP